jgi:hypothetical protein
MQILNVGAGRTDDEYKALKDLDQAGVAVNI